MPSDAAGQVSGARKAAHWARPLPPPPSHPSAKRSCGIYPRDADGCNARHGPRTPGCAGERVPLRRRGAGRGCGQRRASAARRRVSSSCWDMRSSQGRTRRAGGCTQSVAASAAPEGKEGSPRGRAVPPSRATPRSRRTRTRCWNGPNLPVTWEQEEPLRTSKAGF